MNVSKKAPFLLALAVILIASSQALWAKTPDGKTPAEETICDPLKEDGVTKGLYGLCVAFCEANDFASEDIPMTPDEILALEDSAPSGKILQNYNRKKQEGDPDMPCVVVEEEAACPCWTDEELAAIDGIAPTSVFIFNCSNPANLDAVAIQEFSLSGLFIASAWLQETDKRCLYFNQSPGVPAISRELSVDAGSLTEEQAEECLIQVTNSCTSLGWPFP